MDEFRLAQPLPQQFIKASITAAVEEANTLNISFFLHHGQRIYVNCRASWLIVTIAGTMEQKQKPLS